MNQAEILQLTQLLKKIGENVEVDKEDVDFYFPDISDSESIRKFYIPRIPVETFDGVYARLRKLTLPRSIR